MQFKTRVILFSAAFALCWELTASAAEIAGGNGGFETNTFTNPGYAGIQNLWETTAGTVSGWTFTGTGRWFMRNDGDNSGAPHGGEYYLNLALGEHGGFAFSATTAITGLTVGQTYAVEFFASKRIGTTAGVSFRASVNTLAPANLTVTEASLPAITSGYANYAKQTLTFVATATSHTFTLSNAGTGSSNGFLVDDFSVVPVIVPYVPPGTLADYNEVWTSPSTYSWESMPLGNGETSLNVWVEGNGDLLFYIGRSDAESEGNTNLKLGRVRVKLTPNPFATGQPFNQTLDLATGRILITAGASGAQTRLRVWVDANHPVIRVTGDSDAPVSIAASYELDWRTLNTATAIADAHQGDYVLNDGANAITWYHRNRASAFNSNLAAEGLVNSLATVPDPLMNRTFGGRMSGTGFVRNSTQKIVSSATTTNIDLAVDVHAGVYPQAISWQTNLTALATARLARDSAADLAAHQAWWSAFWGRSHLDLGGSGDQARLISKYYAHQRFINACTTRGAFPTPFNGSTLTMDRPAGYPSFFGLSGSAQNADYRDWNGLRIFWQNTRHIYWPLLISGDYDMTESIARVARNILPICRERAMLREGNPGMLLFEGIGVGGDTVFGNNVPAHLTEHRGGMTDVAILLADIYDHTRDQAFFTDTYQLWADEVVTFFEHKFPNRDAVGRMLFSPSAAVETYKNSRNPAPEVGPVRRILSDLLRLDPGTLTVAQRAHYQELLDIMPEPPLKTVLNQPMLGVYQTGDPGRSLVETPSLYSVWPSRLSGLGRPAWLAAGRRDHGSRMYSLDGTVANSDPTFESGGWLYTPTVAAQLNLPQQAKFYALRNFLNPIPDTVGNGTVVLSNPYPGKPRFHAFWESRFDYIPDQCHGGSTTIGLQHMVVQSQGDKIYLLPAWPEEWDLNFKVHAALNTVLEGVYSNGVLQSLTVTPPSRAADVINMASATNRIRGIVGVCVTDANYLLGLAPMRDGLPVLPAATASAVTGSWFSQYGYTLDGGLAGPFIASEWGGSMAKGNSIYLHVLNWSGETITLPTLALGRQITNHAVLTGGSATVTQSASGISVTLPTANHDPIDTIIRLDLDGSAEALAWYQPYVGSATIGAAASASAETTGHEAAQACDADANTSWRHGASSATLTIPLGGVRNLNRIDIQFDNGTSFSNQTISVTLEVQSPSGTWSTLWSGTAYNLVLSRPCEPTKATAIRLTTNAQGVRQIDAFTEPALYTRTDDGATGNTTIEVPAYDVLFRESLTGSDDLLKTGPGTLSLIDAAGYAGATRILEGTLLLHPPLSAPAPGFSRWFDASSLALTNGAPVSKWNDLSGNAAHATPQTGHPPTFIANAVNGLGAVAFTGTAATTSESLNFTRASSLWTIFSVFRGASFLLTDTATTDFHRPNDTDPAAPLWAPAANGWNSAYILNGQTYVNGTPVDGTSFAMPTNANNGFNQVTVATTGPARADGFNRDRIYHAGNQDQAEVILYGTALSEVQRLGTERYLRTKWFGEPTVSSILPTNTAVSLENSNCIFDLNGATQSVTSLGIAPGSVVMLNGGTLVISGNQGNAVVQGAITGPGNLVNRGTLRLVGNASLSSVAGFTNTGVLDLMTWSGVLPAGFVNQGVVLDRSLVAIRSLTNTNAQWTVSIDGYAGHNYQLQRCDQLGGGWVNIGASQAGAGATLQLEDSTSPVGTSGFYRVMVSP
jgi:autotransporter-associated beta strand protein